MIKKLIRQMLTAQILSALTVSLCLLIDSIVIGRFLGENAIAAYGLANPILLIIGAFGSALSAGVQVTCSKSLGKGSQEETNQGYSSAIAMAAAFSIPFTIIVFVLSRPISAALGANSGQLLYDTNAYLRGFIIGAPATMGALILVPFLQMAGQMGLLIASVGAMTVVDITLDILNVTVFNGGMFGMGLASSLSYYAALLIGGSYFLSKKCFFRFSFRQILKSKIKELVSNSIPAVFHMAASVVQVFVMNRILMGTGGSMAVAAFSVMSTIGNTSNCITTGIGGVSLTLTGIFYNEEDRTSLKTLLQELARASVMLGAIVGILLLIFAPYAVELFIGDAGRSKDMAVLGLRIYAPSLIPYGLNSMLKNAYQGSGRVRYIEVISIIEIMVLPIAAALILTIPFGTTGAWFYALCGESLMLVLICLFVRRKTGGPAWKDLTALILPDDFSVPPDEMIEMDVKTLDDVVVASKKAHDFCTAKCADVRTNHRIAVCIEEMASNVVSHGFTKDDKDHQLSIRLIHKNNHWTLRFRDDCTAFDPVRYVPHSESKAECMGIRLVMGLADDIRYTYSMSMNNLMIVLKE